MKRLSLALAGVLICTAPAWAEPFTGGILNVSFDIPSGWKATEHGGSETAIVFVSPTDPDGSNPRKWTTVTIRRRGPRENYEVPKDLTDAAAGMFREMDATDEWGEPGPPYKVLSQGDAQFGGLPAKKITYLSDPETSQARNALMFLVLKDGYIFDVSFFCETADFKIDWPGAKRIMDSFKFS